MPQIWVRFCLLTYLVLLIAGSALSPSVISVDWFHFIRSYLQIRYLCKAPCDWYLRFLFHSCWSQGCNLEFHQFEMSIPLKYVQDSGSQIFQKPLLVTHEFHLGFLQYLAEAYSRPCQLWSETYRFIFCLFKFAYFRRMS